LFARIIGKSFVRVDLHFKSCVHGLWTIEHYS